MTTVKLAIRGEPPVPWGGNEWEWRRAVAREAKIAKVPLPLPPKRTFPVRIPFHLAPSTLARADLDNLAKPVLDTLFESRNAQVPDESLTGALFAGVDDDRVFSLHLDKRAALAPEEEGADISVTWSKGRQAA